MKRGNMTEPTIEQIEAAHKKCPECGGLGKHDPPDEIFNEPCPSCNGTGTVREWKITLREKE